MSELPSTPRLGRIRPATFPDETQHARQRGGVRSGEIVVIDRALTADEWGMVRAFVRRTEREALRLRFGQAADFADDSTLKRFFGIKDKIGEMIWMLDEDEAVCGILHRVLISPTQAEIAVIVRSDRARRGIGRALLRTAVSRAASQDLKRLSALVHSENIVMLRLARSLGFAPRKSFGLAVELELDLDLDLGQTIGCSTGTASAAACAPIVST
ncbi:MAG: N-acetyltransferase family protein [Xanthobacteraceae bacterium]